MVDPRTLRRVINAGVLPASDVLIYQRVAGNQAVQRLLAERGKGQGTPATRRGQATGPQVVQRDYLTQPHQNLVDHFAESKYGTLVEKIAAYRQSPNANARIRLMKLSQVIEALNRLPSHALNKVMTQRLNTLQSEIESEELRLRGGQQEAPAQQQRGPTQTQPEPKLQVPTQPEQQVLPPTQPDPKLPTSSAQEEVPRGVGTPLAGQHSVIGTPPKQAGLREAPQAQESPLKKFVLLLVEAEQPTTLPARVVAIQQALRRVRASEAWPDAPEDFTRKFDVRLNALGAGPTTTQAVEQPRSATKAVEQPSITLGSVARTGPAQPGGPVSADPAISTAKQTVIRAGSYITDLDNELPNILDLDTNVTGVSHGPAPFDCRIKTGANYRSDTREFVAKLPEPARMRGQSAFTHRILPGTYDTVDGLASRPFNNPKLVTVVRAGQGTVEFIDGARGPYVAPTSKVEAVDMVTLTDYRGNQVTAQRSDTEAATFILFKLDRGGTVVAAKDTIVDSAASYKALNPVEPLYPSGGAKADDIRQLGLGDCYLQSVLVSIATTDPGHFQTMMPDTPGQKTVTVHFYNVTGTSAAPDYEAAPITVQKTLPESATGAPLHNAGASWARLIQKAFVVFAGKYGRYGQAFASLSSGARNEGSYEGIHAGAGFMLYGVFYGPARNALTGRSETSYQATDDDQANLISNRDTISKLLQFKGQGIAKDEAVNLTTEATVSSFLQRTQDIMPACIKAMERSGNIKNLVWFQQALGRALQEQQHSRDEPLSQKPAVNEVVVAAGSFLEGDYGPLVATIKKSTGSRELQTLHEMLLNIRNIGADTSVGKRFVYAEHSYAIVDVALKTHTGAPFKGQIDQLDSELKNISATQSTVTLRNPLRKDEPNPSGEQVTGQQARGTFTLTLAQQLRNFSRLDYGRVKKST